MFTAYLSSTEEAVYLSCAYSNQDVWDDLRLPPSFFPPRLFENAAEDPSIPPVVMNLPGGPGAPCEDALVPERFITSEMWAFVPFSAEPH